MISKVRMKNPQHKSSKLKSMGKAVYISDLEFPNMLYGDILRSYQPHAKIKRVDVSKAESLPGVRAVITFGDVYKYGKYNCSGTPPSPIIMKDEYILSDKMRFFGDKVAAVAAEDKKTLQDALDLIKVEYDILPSVLGIEEAIADGAPAVHDAYPDNIAQIISLKQGNLKYGFEQADLIHKGEYRTHAVQAAPLETTGCICSYTPDNCLTVWSNTQTPHQDKRILAELFDISESNLRMIQPHIGGAFGSRQQLHQQPVGSLLSKIAGAPVKMVYSREEEFYTSAVRHPSLTRIQTGVKQDGTITAMSIQIYLNTGGYATHGPIVLAAIKSRIPYRVPHYEFKGYCVYTNAPSAGAMRGYGNPQVTFAREIHMDEIATKLHINPVELRLKNHIKVGDSLPGLDWRVESCGIEECIKEALEARNSIIDTEQQTASSLSIKTGWGLAFCLHGSGIADRDVGSAIIILNDDGSINLVTGAVDLGQGSDLALAQIAAREIGIENPDQIQVISNDTAISPYDTGTFSSRQVYVSGNAVQQAAYDLKIQLIEKVATKLSCNTSELDIKGGQVIYKKEDRPISTFKEAVTKISFGPGSAVIIGRSFFKPNSSPPPFAVCYVKIKVNIQTGELIVPVVIIAADVGKAINPQVVEGQIEGGVMMGLAYTLSEDLAVIDMGGRSLNTGFMRYGFPTSKNTPRIIVKIIESNEPTGPFGAKSVGELPTIPVAPAIANAFYDATGARIRELPFTPVNVLRCLKNK